MDQTFVFSEIRVRSSAAAQQLSSSESQQHVGRDFIGIHKFWGRTTQSMCADPPLPRKNSTPSPAVVQAKQAEHGKYSDVYLLQYLPVACRLESCNSLGNGLPKSPLHTRRLRLFTTVGVPHTYSNRGGTCGTMTLMSMVIDTATPTVVYQLRSKSE